MQKRWIPVLIVSIVLVTFTMGCPKKAKVPPPPPPKPKPIKEEPPPPPELQTLEKPKPILEKDLEELNKMGLLKDIFFDYNKYEIREDQQQRLLDDVRTLQQYPTFKIVLEGHCDERGSNEYNMALGWKRANTVKGFLTKNGIDANRVETVSYGEERPFSLCHDETCWSQNRRGHFVIIGK